MFLWPFNSKLTITRVIFNLYISFSCFEIFSRFLYVLLLIALVGRFVSCVSPQICRPSVGFAFACSIGGLLLSSSSFFSLARYCI
jgi:hypothetical protein